MINSILEFISCKKCLNDENKSEIIINNEKEINENNAQINEDDEIDFADENKKNMEFIQNIQKEIEQENLKMKNEIIKEKTILEENYNRQGNFANKKE